MAVISTASCTKRSKPKPSRPVPSAAPLRLPEDELTPQLEELIRLSKSTLGPDARRAGFASVLGKFSPDQIKKREELIVRAVARGAYDPPVWTSVTADYAGRRAEIQVSADALTILGVRVDVTADGAQRIADLLGTVLPTPRILQLVWEQATVRIEPCTEPADEQMASTARMLEHSECVDQRIAGKKGLVANEGKHWVLSNRIAGKGNLAANYGWFVKGQRPIQTVGTHHDTAHTDYSQIMRLVKPKLEVDGRELDIRQVGRSPELWGLVSDEGPLLVWRVSRPDAAPSPTALPRSAAPPPAPADPSSVHVTLKPDGMPVVPERLPPTTTGLRRNTLARRSIAALLLRPEDVPEAAYVSAGAAACGGRDVFFELMNDVPVDLALLEQSKEELARALACGKALAPSIHAGARLYEVEYDYQDVPSRFALLSLSDHGELTASAREAPSLLARLAGNAAPPPDVAELAALFLEPTPAEEVAVAKGGGGCGFAVNFTFLDLSPDETNRERVLDAINDNAVLCGTQTSGPIFGASRRLIFSTKDEAAAQAIEAALKRHAFEIRLEASGVEPRGSVEQKFNDALRSAAARAASAASIEVTGRRLSYAMALAPNAAEKRDMAPLLDARAAKAERVATIVEGLAAGKLPSADDLEASSAPTNGADGGAAK